MVTSARQFPQTPANRLGVFTAIEAAAAGWTASALRSGVARGRVIRLQRGVYAPGEHWAGDGFAADERRLSMRTVAAMLVIDRAAASHTSAAVMAGQWVWTRPERPCLTVPPRYTGDAAAVHLHRAGAGPGDILSSGPIPRMSTSRTIIDIAREHGAEDAVVVGDCALARGMTDAERLMRVAEFCDGWPGMRRAHRVLGLLDARSESPLESVSRLRLSDAGVPAPEPQADIIGLSGLLLGRPDLYWDEYGVAGEVDGKLKYGEDPFAEFWKEKRRQEPMEETGLIFVRWGRSDLEDMNRLVARLDAAFARGARRPRSDRGWIAQPNPAPRLPRFAPPVRAR